MNRRGRRLAAAALLAAAAVLTGCGGDTSARPHATAAPMPSARGSGATASPAATAKAGTAKERTGEEGPAADAPKVPASALKPVTGSFTSREKKFLVGRVPRGTDPAAVLQIGQESCDRITRTAKQDRDAAISAIRSGQITDAASVITQLCPQHEPLLKAAGKGGGG